jgi:hypothetical protein
MPSAATATAAQHLRRARDVPARTANRGDPQPLTAGPNTIDLQKHSSGAPHPNPSWSCGFDSRHRPPKPRSSIEPHRLAVLSLDETDLLGAGAVDSTGIPARNLFSPEYYPAPTGNAAIAGNSRTGMGSAFSAFRNDSSGFTATLSDNSWQDGNSEGAYGGTSAAGQRDFLISVSSACARLACPVDLPVNGVNHPVVLMSGEHGNHPLRMTTQRVADARPACASGRRESRWAMKRASWIIVRNHDPGQRIHRRSPDRHRRARPGDVVFPRKPKYVGAWFDLLNDHQLVVLDGASDEGVDSMLTVFPLGATGGPNHDHHR